MNHIAYALIFFLPAGTANIAPILAKRLPIIRRWKAPIDGGLQLRGKRLLGNNKSWRGLVTAVLAGAVTGAIVYPLISESSSTMEHLLIGGVIGFGAILGDAVESFFKRQRGVKSGDSWLFFDQVDYVIGALLFGMLFARFSLTVYAAIISFYFIGHLVMTYVGFLLGLKEKPI